ncbi:heavy metal translocating P-type ATPase [Kaistia algarum]|uniref:heavy metal translocating P-type ATPase n=1 Tax=Kaistia algarum TaxID=2083279 RepID=UPI000CE7EA6F|nr:heavy metal translocating P-type ATPase [Kaistia algarum]MCX5514403.1 heavy metal translocating P-type ATPase [Kaistia algarum]PPE79250.1 heavy metal translocating P-type ATPase [Kaistia algarum]
MPAIVSSSRFRIDEMDCASCARKIDTAVRRIGGVDEVNVSVTAGTMTVRHDGDEAIRARIEVQVSRLGYGVAFIPAPEEATATATDAALPASDHHHDHDGHGHAEDGAAHSHEGHDHRDHGGHDRGPAPEAAAVERAGKAEPVGLHSHLHEHGSSDGPWWRQKRALLTIGSGVALVAAYGLAQIFPQYDAWLFSLAMLVGLVPIARRAVMATLAGTPFSIETLMTIAAVGAVIIGAAEEAAAVVFLFLIGELLEGVAAGRARASIQGLAALVPKTAQLERGGKLVEVPAESLAVGAVILVRPGDRIAADGRIIEGSSEINEAPVTGESTPKRKEAGDDVFAGTVNGGAVLRIEATAASADNTIARIVKLVEEAQESKAPTERFIDRFSTYYTPGVIVVAALIALVPPLFFGGGWDEWIYKGLAILLIGCPCALVISTPAAIAASLSAGARRGLLMKGGAVLETVGKVTAVALDKTGTLTEGKPKVTDVLAFGRSEADVIRLAAALDQGSSHPLALAILGRAAADKVEIPKAEAAQAVGGKGVTGLVDGEDLLLGSPKAASERAPLTEAQLAQIATLNDEGKTVSVLVVGTQIAGAIAMRDEPRDDAAAGLKALGDRGVRIVMLTGDNQRTAEAIGRDLGIEVRSELLPEDKSRIVGELQAEGHKVAKVGDGINDAPALAAADVGIAMGGGTDVALETADAAVLHGRVMDIAAMIDLSKRTMSNIGQNITIALGLKAVFLVTTVIGLTGLWPAILADTGATVLVTANAMRLLAWRPKGA